MNYRHAFHAGNFADVLKHAVLALVLEHLKLKPKPFAVIDTHAGVGLYRLDGPEAARTGEWQHGIGRLLGPDAGPLPDAIAHLLSSYLGAVTAANPDGGLTRYPGSPALALALMRPQDRLVANELHPEDAEALRRAIGRDPRARVLALDGWLALKANLPPKERRGVVLIDPPFEEPGEFDRLVQALGEGLLRFATGTYLLWFPIKDARAVAAFEAALARLELEKLVWAELRLTPRTAGAKLHGTGLAILNPPFRLAEQLETLLAFLAGRLATEDAGASWSVRRPGLLRVGTSPPDY
ncbi:MAG: 23S rRNA (adenine(2030)-N(6))-methyltransferase RlmJ [Hyphomicrobiaceae bacterium]|nr:23S rRNA (adenine(2030)-N(6))-methyltransferase RlmJ [Hyphomicrobiaceae bacterium]